MGTSSEFRDECQTHRRATQCAAGSNRGLTLFHCHQQLHMDFGFMTLFDYVTFERRVLHNLETYSSNSALGR